MRKMTESQISRKFLYKNRGAIIAFERNMPRKNSTFYQIFHGILSKEDNLRGLIGSKKKKMIPNSLNYFL